MPYLIDGHNLIGKIPDIRLSDLDDEEQLVKRLVAFCRAKGKKVEVVFDKAAPGQTRTSSHGAVSVKFTPIGQTADDAIVRRLQQLKRQARNWTVVSSDRQVQANARAVGATVVASEAFVGMLDAENEAETSRPDYKMGEDEVQEWLDLFSGGDSE